MRLPSRNGVEPGMDGTHERDCWEGESAAQRLRRLLAGCFVSQALRAAAELDIAERLTEGPKNAAALAGDAGLEAHALHRLLRALASVGVFREDEQGRFANTELSELLRAASRDSQRAAARMYGAEPYWKAAGGLLHSVRTGKPAFDALFGMPFFDYLSRDSDLARVFDEAMVSTAELSNSAMLEAYDFSHLRTITDVGGGYGSTLCAILRTTPRLRGILFDLPHAAEGANRFIARQGLSGRCKVMTGDFFDAVPGGADAYFMRHILHDWDDERCVRLLRNCRAGMTGGGKLLVCERILPPGNQPCYAKISDLIMMVLSSGGRERSEGQYRELLAAAGFALTRVVTTRSDHSVLEAVASQSA